MLKRVGSTPAPQIYTCPIHETTSSRNLVVCIDGTSNQFGPKNTNIVEFYSHITKSDTQFTYYSSGLGAFARVAGSSLGYEFSNSVDMAIGRNLHKVIMTSYRWLSDNYQDGDSIYLFGYSRGAYQVRALAGMIHRVGLLLPGNNEQIPFAFELYTQTTDDDASLTPSGSVISRKSTTKESKKKARFAELAKTFQRTFCRRSKVHIHFVGVWDTVSSFGFLRRKTLPCTTTSCEHICYFRHALALDERRVKFLPEYAYGGRSNHGSDERVKEVWFAGCHADVGGGNRYNERLQSGDVPLLWMRSQAIAFGLDMMPADMMWKIDDLNKRITPSLVHMWWLLELLPFAHLLYYNSNKCTSSPHWGGPRRILPGQKVHVSVLFKNNYRPYAHFHNNPEGWPGPMFWNDAVSHRRLQTLSDYWDKDIFDESSVGTLLDNLRQGSPNVDALERLAFMASFDVCKNVIAEYDGADQILAKFLENKDKLVRLSTAATYCELGWGWPSKMNYSELGQKIIQDISNLLHEDEHCRRACMYLPSLCKWTDLKEGLLVKDNLERLVKLCDSTRVTRHEEETSTVAFYSAQALSILMKLDIGVAERLIEIHKVTDITQALHSKCNTVLVSVLGVVEGLAKYEEAREVMRIGPTVATLLRLVRQFDDFVAPAAVRVLCSFLPDDELRKKMVDFGVLSAFLDMVNRCSAETKQVTCVALAEFAQRHDIQGILSEDGHLRTLAKRAKNHIASTRDGAILALVHLGENQAMRKPVAGAIEAEKTIHALVSQLKRKSTALSAASALTRLSKIEDVVIMVSNDETGACKGIVNMVRWRWFDGVRGEDGLRVLSELLECERLRSAVLNAGVLDVLLKMIDPEHTEDVHAGLHYLRVIADTGKGRCALSTPEALSLVPHVVKALRSPHRKVQRIATEVLRFLSAEVDLRAPIVEELLDLLTDRRAGVLVAVSTLLGSLAVHKSVREMVLSEESFLNLCHEYYDGLESTLNEKGGGYTTGEAYRSVRQMIKVMQLDESDDAGVSGVEGKGTEKQGEPVMCSKKSNGMVPCAV